MMNSIQQKVDKMNVNLVWSIYEKRKGESKRHWSVDWFQFRWPSTQRNTNTHWHSIRQLESSVRCCVLFIHSSILSFIHSFIHLLLSFIFPFFLFILTFPFSFVLSRAQRALSCTRSRFKASRIIAGFLLLHNQQQVKRVELLAVQARERRKK